MKRILPILLALLLLLPAVPAMATSYTPAELEEIRQAVEAALSGLFDVTVVVRGSYVIINTLDEELEAVADYIDRTPALQGLPLGTSTDGFAQWSPDPGDIVVDVAKSDDLEALRKMVEDALAGKFSVTVSIKNEQVVALFASAQEFRDAVKYVEGQQNLRDLPIILTIPSGKEFYDPSANEWFVINPPKTGSAPAAFLGAMLVSLASCAAVILSGRRRQINMRKSVK